MIAQVLARVETELAKLVDDMAVDAFYDRAKGQIETVFISTVHDPSVGIFGGRAFTLWWDFGGDEEELEREGHPVQARVVREDLSPIQHRKRWGPPEGWEDVYEIATSKDAERIAYRALIDIHLQPF